MQPNTNNKRDAIKQALNLRYNVRFNSITAKLEYAPAGSEEYAEVTADVMRDFKAELKNNGISVTQGEIINAFSGDVFTKNDNSNDEKIQLYINTIMQTRFNTIKTRCEYRLFDDKTGTWRTLDKYFLNSLALQIRAYGLKTSRQALQDLLESEFSPKVNPLCQYFEELPEYDGDPIQELADTVKVKNTDTWPLYLRRWLVATLANVYDDERNTNQTMIVLCGAQGVFKTTWIENLIPEKIRRYMYSGKLDMERDKDNNAHLAENLIINLDDQMKDLLRKTGAEAIKNIITKNYITYRRPYDVQTTDYPRIASFIGSVNGTEFLTDPTGNRRFLPFEVEAINIDAAKSINMERVWRQAYDLYRDGYRYYFTKDEIGELSKNNERFTVTNLEEQLLLQYYQPADKSETRAEFVAYIDMFNFLLSRTAAKLDERKIKDALKKNEFEPVRGPREAGSNYRPYGYYVFVNSDINL